MIYQPPLTDKQKLLLRVIFDRNKDNLDKGRASTGQIWESAEVQGQMAQFKMNSVLHSLSVSGHLTKQWPNWFKLTDKGKGAIGES